MEDREPSPLVQELRDGELNANVTSPYQWPGGFPPGAAFDVVLDTGGIDAFHELERDLCTVAAALRPGGIFATESTARERLDEKTAQWAATQTGVSTQAYQDDWNDSNWIYSPPLRAPKPLERMRSALTHFDEQTFEPGPGLYAHDDYDQIARDHEQAAIDAGLINPIGFRFVGSRRPTPPLARPSTTARQAEISSGDQNASAEQARQVDGIPSRSAVLDLPRETD